MKYYAGIGARKTPQDVLFSMRNIGLQLAMRGYHLRSGAAIGADQAFEYGCDIIRGPKTIRCATLWQKALDHAAQFHPAWDQCDETARGLHARNSMVMLGDDFNTPVSFAVCWTEGGAIKGGTGQALRIAAHYGIPVCNLAVTTEAAFWSWLDASR